MYFSDKWAVVYFSDKWAVMYFSDKWAVMYFCFIGIDFASPYDFAIGFLNCLGSGMFLINISFCHFHVSTLLPCHLSCFYFAALSFSCFYFAALSFPHSWFITGFTTRLTRWVPLVDNKLLTLPEGLSSPSVFSGVHVTRSLVLCVFFIDRCWSFCPFSFDHCAVCPSSI
jgi:hypothetical protein